MNNFEKFGKIKDLSDRRRLPLLGKIRLGLKVKNQKGIEYPTETDYFVVPDEVKAIYGEKPTEIDVMFPTAKKETIFSTAYRWYGKTRGLKCLGNGEVAVSWSEDKKIMEEIICPCSRKDKECKKRAFLMCILPQVNMGGVYQISTSSVNSIIDINSGLDYVEALVGRVQMVPLQLKREKIETHFEGKKQSHYTLKLTFAGNIDFINRLRSNTNRILLDMEKIALPSPQDENPEYDPVDQIVANGIKDAEDKEDEKTVEQVEEKKQATKVSTTDTEVPKSELKRCIALVAEITEKLKLRKISQKYLITQFYRSGSRWGEIPERVLIQMLTYLSEKTADDKKPY